MPSCKARTSISPISPARISAGPSSTPPQRPRPPPRWRAPTSKTSIWLQADLTGATLRNANFYSTFAPRPELSARRQLWPHPHLCQRHHATLKNARFSGAYLNGVDFSGATPQNVDFTGAWLVGVNFTNANLSHDISTGSPTISLGPPARRHVHQRQSVQEAILPARWSISPTPQGATLLLQLNPATHIASPAISREAGSTLGCVEFTYSSSHHAAGDR